MPEAVLARYAELQGRDDLLTERLVCVETVSTPLKGGLLRRPKPRRTVAGVTRRYLIWFDASGAISAARVDQIEAREFESAVIEDSGLDVTGFRLGGFERESWFLPLDDGSDARNFRDCLAAAIEDASGDRRPG